MLQWQLVTEKRSEGKKENHPTEACYFTLVAVIPTLLCLREKNVMKEYLKKYT